MLLTRQRESIEVGGRARLYLNGSDVGTVTFRRRDGAWRFGEFTPAPAFTAFAPVFGLWSLLMHAHDETETLSEAASDELRQTENAIDALRAALRVGEESEPRPIIQLNIDGPLIEWLEA